MAAREPFNVTGKTGGASQLQHSPWHSPVPYLFGGLAAMLGLIAFALLILACSYWKLSGYLESNENSDGDRDLEAGEGKGDEKVKPAPVFEEKFLVIMAGNVKPTFLATPVSSRNSSFGDSSSKSSCSSESSDKTEDQVIEKVKQGNDDELQSINLQTHQTSNQ